MPDDQHDPAAEPTSRVSLQQQALARAERHVAKGEDAVAHQRTIVADLERDGHDATLARELLAAFEETLASHKTDRARRQLELSTAGAVRTPDA